MRKRNKKQFVNKTVKKEEASKKNYGIEPSIVQVNDASTSSIQVNDAITSSIQVNDASTSSIQVNDASTSSIQVNEASTSSIQVPLEGVKHPLENTWSFWMFTNEKKNWEENLIELTSFDTVEDFWCLYHYMKAPSELVLGQDYSVFKKGITPKWEDEANKKGGRWLITLEKRRSELDWMWLHVVLLMIGENFLYNNEIRGATVNFRAKCKIGIWTANAENEDAVMEIGRKIRETLGGCKLIYLVLATSKPIYFI